MANFGRGAFVLALSDTIHDDLCALVDGEWILAPVPVLRDRQAQMCVVDVHYGQDIEKE